MDPKVISSTDLRIKTRDIIENAKFKGQHYIVKTFGKPMVAIVGIDDYYALINPKISYSQRTDTTEAAD